MRYVVSIGSNEHRRANMRLARKRLSALFRDILFSREMETAPLYLHRTGPFSNQVACFHSDLHAEDVYACLKRIEHEAGRRPEDKHLEIVKLDIDLLMCGDNIIRPEDWTREYVQCGLKYLNIL